MATILHLSDIHYGDDFLPWALKNFRGNSKRPTDAITRGLSAKIRELNPVYTIISGDFVNKARPDEFAEAAQYLRNLLTNAGVDIQKSVLIIPGNHDVGFFGRKPDESKRLKNYRGFINAFYQDENPEQRLSKFVRRCDTHRLIFLALDTTLKSLSPRADGEIGKSQLLWAKQQLDETRRQMGADFHRYTKIAIMHHHCAPITGEDVSAERNMQLLDAGGLMELLIENGFDIVLHGHKHIPHVSPVYRENGAILAIVGAGTALAPYPDQRGVYGNNFNLLQINQKVRELSITRYDAAPDGSFVPGKNATLALGRPITGGYKTGTLRRVLRIANNGDTEVISERSDILVIGANRVREIPLGFSTDVPGAEISDFQFTPSQGSTIRWSTNDNRNRVGVIVFAKDRTVHDGGISLEYRYTIKKETIMSLAEKVRRYGGTTDPFQEQRQSIGSDVDELLVDLQFPPGYSVTPSVFFMRNGVQLDESVFLEKYQLVPDKILNIWSFSMVNPPLDHGIILRWELPQEWPH